MQESLEKHGLGTLVDYYANLDASFIFLIVNIHTDKIHNYHRCLISVASSGALGNTTCVPIFSTAESSHILQQSHNQYAPPK